VHNSQHEDTHENHPRDYAYRRALAILFRRIPATSSLSTFLFYLSIAPGYTRVDFALISILRSRPITTFCKFFESASPWLTNATLILDHRN
jgi:hypothetical protein